MVFDVRKAGIIVGVLASKWEQVGDLKRGRGFIDGVETNRNMKKKNDCKGLKCNGNKISD